LFFSGHYYTANYCAPTGLDFQIAGAFLNIFNYHLDQYDKSYPELWKWELTTSLWGPVLEIAIYDKSGKQTFLNKILIYQEIMVPMLTAVNGQNVADMRILAATAERTAQKAALQMGQDKTTGPEETPEVLE